MLVPHTPALAVRLKSAQEDAFSSTVAQTSFFRLFFIPRIDYRSEETRGRGENSEVTLDGELTPCLFPPAVAFLCVNEGGFPVPLDGISRSYMGFRLFLNAD